MAISETDRESELPEVIEYDTGFRTLHCAMMEVACDGPH